jgi:Plasmid pRiA4b ORF-3-like protein.
MVAQQQMIYQFKITLLGMEKRIWRRIQVPENGTFFDLHVAIQCAMGWEDCHLHMFRIGKRSGIIINGNPIDDDFYQSNKNTLNGWETDVAQFLAMPGDFALYEYDMGDGWLHEVLLEGVFLKEKNVKYPRCLDGAGACPPEDCGGAPGFEHLLKILASPKHPEYKEMLAWLGRDFDPDAFDCSKIKFVRPATRWKQWQE